MSINKAIFIADSYKALSPINTIIGSFNILYEDKKYFFWSRTDIDFIALDKGEITARKAVDMLIEKMEQYANFGFDFIQEKLEENPNYFFKDTAFLRVFTSFLNDQGDDEDDYEVPESLD